MTHHTRRRIVTVILAPVAALAAWGLTQLLGIGLDVTVGDGTVGPGDVFVYALVGALGGWAVVRLVEGHSRYPRSRWALIGSTTLAVSIIGPSWFADGAGAVALISLHVVTAVVVIIGFAATLPVHRGVGSRAAAATAEH